MADAIPLGLRAILRRHEGIGKGAIAGRFPRADACGKVTHRCPSLSVAQRVYIMQKGTVTLSGPARDCTAEVLLQHLGV